MRLITALFFICMLMGIANAAPYASWYLDELGTVSYPYALDDAQGSNDGSAQFNAKHRKWLREGL